MTEAIWRRRLTAGAFFVLMLLCLVPMVFVFYWMFTLSIKRQVDATAYPPLFFAFRPTLAHYAQVLNKTPFLKYTWNSLLVAVGSTGLGLLLGLPAAFSIARYRQQGVALSILVVRIIPAISFLLPWYIVFRKIHLLDTYAALILTHMVVALPLILWMMINFFEDLPRELHESALVDGCNTYSGFWRIALPLARPGVAATAILSFISSWNNFLFSVMLAGRATRTLPVAVYSLLTYEEINWGPLAAAATMITLPVLVLTVLAQRHIVSGLTMGGVKG